MMRMENRYLICRQLPVMHQTKGGKVSVKVQDQNSPET
jgi:hypothetical protein